MAAVQACTVDSDCDGRSLCNNATGYCFTPMLFSDGDYRDIVCAITCFLAASLASGAGIGGGGMFVPLLLLIGEYSTTQV